MIILLNQRPSYLSSRRTPAVPSSSPVCSNTGLLCLGPEEAVVLKVAEDSGLSYGHLETSQQTFDIFSFME